MNDLQQSLTIFLTVGQFTHHKPFVKRDTFINYLNRKDLPLIIGLKRIKWIIARQFYNFISIK